MIVLEIVMGAISLGAVALSYWLVMREESDGQGTSDRMEDGADGGWDREEAGRLAREQWEELRDEFLEEGKDYLSQLSNEKIMGMDEYFGPILERIEKNHEEVVFLYNMLGEKDQELKELIQHADSVRSQVHNDIATEYQKIIKVLKELENRRQTLEDTLLVMQNQPEEVRQEPEAVPATEPEPLTDVYDREIKAIEEEEEKEKKEQREKPEQTHFPSRSRSVKRAEAGGNHNQDIMDLFKKGYSVLEISKMLSLGQGEVKFVIDLFQSG